MDQGLLVSFWFRSLLLVLVGSCPKLDVYLTLAKFRLVLVSFGLVVH